MEQWIDLDSFVATLNEKGYDGYFHTEGCCAGTLRVSLDEFLQAWQKGKEAPLVENYLHLSTYLQWNGTDKPKIECNMWVKYGNGRVDLDATEVYIRRIDPHGGLLKQAKLTHLTVHTFPNPKEAIAQVSEKPKNQQVPRFKMR